MSGLAIPSSLPGMRAQVTSVETEITAHPASIMVFDSLGLIDATTIDANNTPTTSILGGLVLSKKEGQVGVGDQSAVGKNIKYNEYDPTKSDGRQSARAVLFKGISMLGPDGSTEDKMGGPGLILLGGRLKVSQLRGFDDQARAQLANTFIFDDTPQLVSGTQIIDVTADTTLLASDSGAHVINASASGPHTVTLPAVSAGLKFTFTATHATAAIVALSAEGTNLGAGASQVTVLYGNSVTIMGIYDPAAVAHLWVVVAETQGDGALVPQYA